MKLYINLTILFVALASISCADEVTVFPTPSTRKTTEPTTVTPVIPTTDSTTSTTTTTTTAAPTTSTSTTTTTTPPPTTSTTTVAPTTSTSTTTTTPAPTTSTTTVAPTTSTTPAPPTPAPPTPPTPTPAPATGTWVYQSNNQTCLIVQMAVQLNLNYTTTDNKTASILYNIPANLTTVQDGSCGNGTENQSITLQWGSKPVSSALLLFKLNATTHQVTLAELVFEINVASELPNGNNDTLKLFHAVDEFTVPQYMSYHCTKVQKLALTADEKSNKTVAWAHVSHLQLEAYHKKNDTSFSTAKDCDAIDTPDIVPIAVGLALAALVVVVLIAYLVGRRRAQARGYVSM